MNYVQGLRFLQTNLYQKLKFDSNKPESFQPLKASQTSQYFDKQAFLIKFGKKPFLAKNSS